MLDMIAAVSKNILILLKITNKCYEQKIQFLFIDIFNTTMLWYLHTTGLYLAEFSFCLGYVHTQRGTEPPSPFFICAHVFLSIAPPKVLFGYLL